jgi:hypothetical protein
MERFGKEPLKGLKEEWRMVRGTLSPKLKERRGGKGKGGSTQRILGKRKVDDTSKLPCHNWSRGNGFCKYADACRYSHDGPKGGSNQSTTMAVTTKKINKEKKNKPSLVITEYESDEEEHDNSHNKTVSWKNELDEEDHLYELIRGVPAVIVRNRNSQSNKGFIPKRNLIGRKIVKIGKNSFFGQKGPFSRTREKVLFCLRRGQQRLKCLWAVL